MYQASVSLPSQSNFIAITVTGSQVTSPRQIWGRMTTGAYPSSAEHVVDPKIDPLVEAANLDEHVSYLVVTPVGAADGVSAGKMQRRTLRVQPYEDVSFGLGPRCEKAVGTLVMFGSSVTPVVLS